MREKINKRNIADQNDKIVACERLARDHNVTRVELLLQYEKFRREHRTGEISKEKFLLEEKEPCHQLTACWLIFLLSNLE